MDDNFDFFDFLKQVVGSSTEMNNKTTAAFTYLKADFLARQILADIAGMPVNTPTNTLTTKIIFGDNKNPQSEFMYRDLSKPVKELPKELLEVADQLGGLYSSLRGNGFTDDQAFALTIEMLRGSIGLMLKR